VYSTASLGQGTQAPSSDFGYRVQNGGAVFRVRLSEHDPNRSMLPVGYNAYILA
jgi:hypothetical protein